MSIKEDKIHRIIEIEGGYNNDPRDSGGETNFGITVAVARANGYAGDMRDLPYSLAFMIYEAKYWTAIRASDMLDLSEPVTVEVLDTGVNMGVRRSSRLLQRGLNVLNLRGALFDDLVVDGWIGNATLGALKEYLRHRPSNGELVLLRILNALQGAKYVELAERREKDEDFVFGWFLMRVD